MAWLQLEFEVVDADAAQTEALLEALGALSVTLTDAADEPILEPDPGATPRWRVCRVAALFALGEDFRTIRESLAAAQVAIGSLRADFLEDGNWLERWRQYPGDYCFRDRLWIAPRDSAVVAPTRGVLLRLDPGLAFGTGAHPTTQLCLDWLAGAVLEESRVLDLGCGSGILGLSARLLGGSEVWAIDHDPQALLATRENAAYNDLMDENLTLGDADMLKDAQPFDVVLANILANPLIELAEQITSLLKPDGHVVLAGLLADQIDEVEAAYPRLSFAAPVLAKDEHGVSWARLVAGKVEPSVNG